MWYRKVPDSSQNPEIWQSASMYQENGRLFDDENEEEFNRLLGNARRAPKPDLSFAFRETKTRPIPQLP